MDLLNHLIQRLKKFGLSEIQSQIFLSLQGKEPKTILEISKSLKIPRTSIYDNCGNLIEKGLLERIIIYKSQKFSAVPISILEDYIEKEKERVQELEENLEILKKYPASIPPHPLETQVKYYHGAQGLKQMIWNTLSAKKEVFGYSIFGRGEIVGKKFYERYAAEFKKRKLRDRVIINPTKESLRFVKKDVKPYKHQMSIKGIRYLPKEKLYISGDISIYDYTYAVCFWKKGEVVGVEIQNPELVKTEKSIFEILWKIARPVARWAP